MASQERVFPQSAAVPFRWRGGRLEVLVVTSMSGNWIVPKGLDEPHLTPRQSAAMEAYEEAGVRGVVWEGVTGVYDKPKWGGKCRVKVYVMLVEEISTSTPSGPTESVDGYLQRRPPG